MDTQCDRPYFARTGTASKCNGIITCCEVQSHRRKNRMVATRTLPRALSVAILVLIFGFATKTPAQTEQSPAIDIINYKITAELLPDSHSLRAQTIVTFKALKQTQSAVLEMNGSLTISSVKGP